MTRPLTTTTRELAAELDAQVDAYLDGCRNYSEQLTEDQILDATGRLSDLRERCEAVMAMARHMLDTIDSATPKARTPRVPWSDRPPDWTEQDGPDAEVARALAHSQEHR